MTDARPADDRITYLIANYNQARFIADCVRSLTAQTDSRWMAVILDDSSTDGSADRIGTLVDDDGRIRVLSSDRNVGYIATLERLIAEAGTDIVAILDADDAVEPEATAELLAAHTRNPGAALVYSRFAEYDESLTNRLSVNGGVVPIGGTAIIDGPVGHILSFRRSAYSRTAGLDREMLYAEDRDLVYKLEELATPVFVDAVLYRYRTVAGSHTRDPEKREIGARNTRKARLAAVERRRLSGVAQLAARWAIACDYAAYSHHRSHPVRMLASTFASVASAVWRRQRGAQPLP
ncbi:MAG: glycosyltransferase [Gemmatimonadota bacterium]|nr:glycosyltransferase [Gemmatimonadota bacterium]